MGQEDVRVERRRPDEEGALRRPRRIDRLPSDEGEPRINERIRVPRVLVVDEEGRKLGEFMTEDAVALARERGLDLIEVSPKARPPVCRIGDFGKIKYEKKKKENIARRRQHQVQVKEVKVRPKTDDHDMNVVIKKARSFLEAGHKVKVTVRFRGREHAHRDIGADQCLRVAKSVEDVGAIESPPRMEGRQMSMLLMPIARPEIRPQGTQRGEGDDRTDGPQEAPTADEAVPESEASAS